MKSRTSGFTIVELLIVIVVLAVLATIVLVSWSMTTSWMRDESRKAETQQWVDTFESYRNRFTVFPTMPTNAATPTTVCPGSFASYSNKCGQYGSATATRFIAASGTAHANLLTQVGKIGNVPSNNGSTINNVLKGPIIHVSQNQDANPRTVTALFINFFEQGCPSGWTNISASLPANISGVLTGLPGGTTATACSLSKNFTYSPTAA
jgi:prepilin-type N-terminal cleavage/methylation domain-containing protein